MANFANEMIQEMENLLKYTSLSLNEIARQLNFDDVSYMCRFFKKETGFTPLKYQKDKTKQG